MAASLTPDEIAYQKAHIKEDRGPLVVSVSAFLIAITTVVVTLRLIARHVKGLRYGWDDFFAVGGLIFTTLMCAINMISVKYGLGKHLLATDPKQGYIILEGGFFLSLVYALGQWFIKMSLSTLYIRLFTTRKRWFKISIYGCMVYVTGWAFGLIVTILAQCRPLSYFWEQYNTSLDPPATGKCTIGSGAAEISTSALNTVTDFVLLILPIIILWDLQLSRFRKIALISIFMIGAFACVAGILRLITTTTAITVESDSTWNAANVYLWTAVEASVGLVCACFPTIAPLAVLAYENIKTLTGSMRSERGTGGRTYPSGSGSGHRASRAYQEWPSGFKRIVAEPAPVYSQWSSIESKEAPSLDTDLTPLNQAGRVLRTDELSISSSHV